MYRQLKPSAGAAGLRVGLAVSRYHDQITAAMRDAAIKQFTDAGGAPDNLHVVPAAGAFELTAICRALAARNDIDAVVAIGCIISGDTMHDRHLAASVAHGLTMITVETGVPAAFGVLTCQTLEQARVRACGDKASKGAEAMGAAIETAHAVKALRETKGHH